MKRFLYIIGGILCIAGAFFAGYGIFSARNAPASSSRFSSGYYTQDFYDAAYDRAGKQAPVDARSAIVAHHVLVADKIAGVFSAIADDNVRTVVMVSPNHFSRGVHAAQVSRGTWDTPYGDVQSDTTAVDRLLAHTDVLVHEEEAYENEHGIAALTPFVARSFPHAKIVPIILHDSLSLADARELGTTLAQTLPDALFIASIDMSHNLPDAIASFHDEQTLRVIANGGCTDTCDLEIDSNPTLAALFAWNTARGTQTWHLTHHDSSLRMGATMDWRENTSHILGYFTDGPPAMKEFASWFVVQDMRLRNGATHASASPTPWKDVHRLWRGAHTIVTDTSNLPDDIAMHMPGSVGLFGEALCMGVIADANSVTLYPIILAVEDGAAVPTPDPED